MSTLLIVCVGFLVIYFAYAIVSDSKARKNATVFTNSVRDAYAALQRSITEKVTTEYDFQQYLDAAEANVSVDLMKDESLLTCYDAVKYVYKRTGEYTFRGPTVRIKIAKGVHYRAGKGKVSAPKAWLPEERGTVVVTTKRVLFIGERSTQKVRTNKVEVESFSKNRMEFRRDNGPNWLFGIEGAGLTPEQVALTWLGASQP